MNEPSVSVLIPARNEQDFLPRTLETVFAQDFPADQIEILVIDGISTDRTPQIVKELARNHPHLRLLTNPRRLPSYGMNIGIRVARGEYVVRMDAHTLYALDYVRKCVELLERGDAAEVGGVQNAIGHSYTTNAIAAAMSHPFGVGDARFRYTDREIYAETVYLGAWKRITLLKLGGFKGEVNEDGELNYRLRQAGGRILVSPEIKLQYLVRKSLGQLARQYAWYGRAKIRTLTLHPDSLMYRQFAPPVLLIALVFSALIFPFSHMLGLLVPAAYVACSLGAAVHLSLRRGMKYLPVLPAVFTVMHISWAWGSFTGMKHFGVPRISWRALWHSIFPARRGSTSASASPEMDAPLAATIPRNQICSKADSSTI